MLEETMMWYTETTSARHPHAKDEWTFLYGIILLCWADIIHSQYSAAWFHHCRLQLSLQLAAV